MVQKSATFFTIKPKELTSFNEDTKSLLHTD